MGFGILLVGYLFNLNFVARQGIFWCAASLIMLYALTRLYEYNIYFKRTFYVAISMTLMSLAAAVLEVYGLFVGDAMAQTPAGAALTWLLTVHPIVMGVFTYLLIMAVMEIGLETGVAVVYQRAVIQRFLCIIFYSLMTFFSFSFYITDLPSVLIAAYNVLRVIVCVFGLVFIMLTARMIFSCYAWICLPEDYDMATKREKRDRALDDAELSMPLNDDVSGEAAGTNGEVKLTQNTGERENSVHPNNRNRKNKRKRR